ncbi:MAG: ABC transporter permease [Treponemataceae bacterium]|nr:ABC transporter permease [Treponemataceae bacterium]
MTSPKLDDQFYFIDNNTIKSEKISAPRYSYWASVFRVFFKNKMNTVLLVIAALIILTAYIMPAFWPYDQFENVSDINTYNLSPSKAMQYFGGFSFKWCLGSGGMGNSIMYGIVSGARTSLSLAFVCAFINMVVGIIMGAIWGYVRQIDNFMLTIYNIVANVPYILLISVLVYVMGAGFWNMVFALTCTGWISVAYFFRTQVMIIRDREYSLASRCLGTPINRMISVNILPFLTSVILTMLASELPNYISMEVFLSFIGMGLSSSIPSLGKMIGAAQTAFLIFPWEFWAPVAVSAAITLILYILGQNLADASDPKTHM